MVTDFPYNEDEENHNVYYYSEYISVETESEAAVDKNYKLKH